MAGPCSAGTCTPQEAPSFAWRTAVKGVFVLDGHALLDAHALRRLRRRGRPRGREKRGGGEGLESVCVHGLLLVGLFRAAFCREDVSRRGAEPVYGMVRCVDRIGR